MSGTEEDEEKSHRTLKGVPLGIVRFFDEQGSPEHHRHPTGGITCRTTRTVHMRLLKARLRVLLQVLIRSLQGSSKGSLMAQRNLLSGPNKAP